MSTLEGNRHRKLLRLEVKNAQTPREPRPDWMRTKATAGREYQDMRQLVKGHNLHTVCAEAGCPNIYECWEDREASFLLGGAICTRRCAFCDIATGKPKGYDKEEPARLAKSVQELGLRYVTITGVARDDLPDGAAWLYAETCRQIHAADPSTGVELLVDDFRGAKSALEEVFSAQPEVFAHNLETVARMMKTIRPAFSYDRTLSVINAAAQAGLITKSNLILGVGETTDEVIETMSDMLEAGVHILTITQYLRPSAMHHPIDRWVKPEEFIALRDKALQMGFPAVMSGPLVRSSYRAGKLWSVAMKALNRPIPEHLKHLEQLGSGPARQEAAAVLERMGNHIEN